MVITDYSFPTQAITYDPANFYVVGHLEGATFPNPAVGIYYYDGPAPYIYVILNNGIGVQVPKGYAWVTYKSGPQSQCTTVDTRLAAQSVMFTEPGKYTIVLVAGFLTPDEASAAGKPVNTGYAVINDLSGLSVNLGQVSIEVVKV